MNGYIWAMTKGNEIVAEAPTAAKLAAATGRTSAANIYRATAEADVSGGKTNWWKVPVEGIVQFRTMSQAERWEWRKNGYKVPEKKKNDEYCDRCSEFLKMGSFSRVLFQRDHWEPKEYRLCRECTIQLRLFLEGDI